MKHSPDTKRTWPAASLSAGRDGKSHSAHCLDKRRPTCAAYCMRKNEFRRGLDRRASRQPALSILSPVETILKIAAALAMQFSSFVFFDFAFFLLSGSERVSRRQTHMRDRQPGREEDPSTGRQLPASSIPEKATNPEERVRASQSASIRLASAQLGLTHRQRGQRAIDQGSKGSFACQPSGFHFFFLVVISLSFFLPSFASPSRFFTPPLVELIVFGSIRQALRYCATP